MVSQDCKMCGQPSEINEPCAVCGHDPLAPRCSCWPCRCERPVEGCDALPVEVVDEMRRRDAVLFGEGMPS